MIPNPKGPSLRRVREQSFGTVFPSIGTTKNNIVFDNGMKHKYNSILMKIVTKSVGFPLDDLDSSESNSRGFSESSDNARDETL